MEPKLYSVTILRAVLYREISLQSGQILNSSISQSYFWIFMKFCMWLQNNVH